MVLLLIEAKTLRVEECLEMKLVIRFKVTAIIQTMMVCYQLSYKGRSMIKHSMGLRLSKNLVGNGFCRKLEFDRAWLPEKPTK